MGYETDQSGNLECSRISQKETCLVETLNGINGTMASSTTPGRHSHVNEEKATGFLWTLALPEPLHTHQQAPHRDR